YRTKSQSLKIQNKCIPFKFVRFSNLLNCKVVAAILAKISLPLVDHTIFTKILAFAFWTIFHID
ncbi:MAG: hypothetical protein ACK5MD_04175, partial [Flavobacteriales bacterium]